MHKNDPEGLAALRHTAAHVMAQAIQHLYPGTKFAIGPAISTGFYYDIESEHVFKQEDFPAIEKEMSKIIKQNLHLDKKWFQEKKLWISLKIKSKITKSY